MHMCCLWELKSPATFETHWSMLDDGPLKRAGGCWALLNEVNISLCAIFLFIHFKPWIYISEAVLFCDFKCVFQYDCGFLSWYIGANSSKASNKCRMENTEIISVCTGELRSAARPTHHCLKRNGNEFFSIKAELQLIPWKLSLREGFGEFCWQWHPLSPLLTSSLCSHMLWDAQQMWSQKGFLVCPPAKSLQGPFALLAHFCQAKAVRGTSCSSIVTVGEAPGCWSMSCQRWALSTCNPSV